MEDKRFSRVLTDPKFRRTPKFEKKVKIDKRFKSMFTDKKFNVKYTVDKRGRPINHTTSEDLKRYYHLSDDDEESDSDESQDNDEKSEDEDDNLSENDDNVDNNDQGSEDDDDKDTKEVNELNEKLKADKVIPKKLKKKLKNLTVDYARGEGNLLSESSSSDDDEESESEVSETEAGIDHKWGELDGDADRTEEATTRLAACNMDWDRIRAIDLMVLFNSFVPAGGMIKSVYIYPSEFGLKRMKEEEVSGPIELIKMNKEKEKIDKISVNQLGDEDHEDSDSPDDKEFYNDAEKSENKEEEKEEGSKYHMEKLRQYQLNRLKYYYAVIAFDSPNTANKIYSECDGMEYESSATKLDLRFIPDDMDFEHPPKEFCEKLPDFNKYQPRFFTTTALQQAKVDLTWDETDPSRIEFAQKITNNKIDEVDDEELKNFVAMSSSEEEEDDNPEEKNLEDEETNTENQQLTDDQKSKNNKDTKSSIEKYRALLLDIEKGDDEDEENDVQMEIEWNPQLKDKAEELIKKKKIRKEDKTPFEAYLEKRKEKRKQKKLDLKKKQDSEKKITGVDSDSDFSDIPSDIDMNDPYFASEFNKEEFKKPSKKIRKNKKGNNDDSSEENTQKQKELELLLLDDDEDEEKGRKHFSLKKIQDAENTSKKKKKNRFGKKNESIEKKSIDDFEINVNDERFSALYSSHAFNIDPTDPQFKKTKNMEKIIAEKLKRGAGEMQQDEDNEDGRKVKKYKAELSASVKAIKNYTKSFNKNKKK